jgi:hypothetical protein
LGRWLVLGRRHHGERQLQRRGLRQRLSGNYNGITGVQQDRPDSTPPAHLLDDFHVHDNLICATHGEHPVGVVADNGDNLAIRSITFTCNTIQSAACPLSLTSVMGSPCRHEHGRTTWRCY